MQNNCDIHSMLFEPDSTKIKVKDFSENPEMEVDEEMKEAWKPIKDMEVDKDEEEYDEEDDEEDEQPVEEDEDYDDDDDDDDQSEDYPYKAPMKKAAAPGWNLGQSKAATNYAGGF